MQRKTNSLRTYVQRISELWVSAEQKCGNKFTCASFFALGGALTDQGQQVHLFLPGKRVMAACIATIKEEAFTPCASFGASGDREIG